MGSITLTNPVAGTEITAGLHATNYSALQTLLNGNLDNVNISGTADLDANARVGVRKDSAGSTFERRRLNFIQGSGVTLTVADDSGNEEVDITIAASGGGVGGELVHSERTSDLTTITATTEGAADTVIAGSAYTYDGTACIAEIVIPGFSNANAVAMTFVLTDGTTVWGQFTTHASTGATLQHVGTFKRKFTPAAGSKTVSLRAFVVSGTGTVYAGTGASGTKIPAYLRITKA